MKTSAHMAQPMPLPPETRTGVSLAERKPGGIRWIQDLSVSDTEIAGGKGANLGELLRFEMPVPPAFVITANAFRDFLDTTGLKRIVQGSLSDLDVNDTSALQAAAAELQLSLRQAPFPSSTRDQILSAYHLLATADMTEPYVAVRSSATLEDMPGASFAGMNETFLNVKGEEAVIEAVRNCWASLYGSRVIFYRRTQEIPEAKLAIAVIVQKMVDSEAAGVMFTLNPSNGDRRTIVIEGAFGLGDTVVSGTVSPDHWEVNKDTLAITAERLAQKRVRSDRDAEGRLARTELTEEQGSLPCLTSEQIRHIAELGKQIEEHYGSPQDIEWAFADGKLFIVQSRPVTAVGAVGAVSPRAYGETMVKGLAASPGIQSGTARILGSLKEGDRLQSGDVLVTRMTEPDWTPLMKRASAIVTDEGGMTAHAAIVSRELGIPCVVGTQQATRRIPDGTEVTVDGRQGLVYRGRVREPLALSHPASAVDASAIVTATRLYINLGQPEMAEEMSRSPVDGVGLLRIEFMVASITGGVHPRRLLKEGKGGEFRDRLAEQLAVFARAFAPRPVVARTTDFRTNEYRNMTGGAEFEPEEANPMIGYRGVHRYLAEPDLFRLELEAFRKVRREEGLQNLILMLPFVRTLNELRHCRKVMESAGLFDDPGFSYWVMAEVPSVVYYLPQYVAEGVRGVSIGSNDLTQLILGVDRDSQRLAALFDERDAAVMNAIQQIISTCHQLGIPCSICGQAPSVYPEITEKLVEWGIDSISVNPDVVDATRKLIARAEQQILMDAARKTIGS